MKTFRRSPVVFLLAVLLMEGCRSTGDYSPTIDVVGSYFPAWMVCIVIGIALALVTRQLLAGFKLNAHLHPAALVYFCMTILFTMAVWLAFFKN